MAREGLSFEAVEAAAKRIESRGERVTLRGVRAEVGSGSLSTIQRHLEDYQGGKKREVANKVSAELELPSRIVQAINDEIQAARDEVTELLSGELEEAKADREALVLEVDRLREENEALTKETSEKIGQLREKVEQAERNESALKNKVIGQELEIQQIRNELSIALSDLRTEHFKLEAQTEALAQAKRELKEEENAHSKTKEKSIKQEAQLQQLEKQMNDEIETRNKALKACSEWEKIASKHSEEKAAIKTRFEQLDRAFEQLNKQYEKQNVENIELRKKNEDDTKMIASLLEEIKKFPMYRNPKNKKETWNGQGKIPEWMAEATASGIKKEEMRG